MTYKYVIVIDQGTHSTRAIIYNYLGEPVFKSRCEIELFHRDAGQVEQNGVEILKSCKVVLDKAHQYAEQKKLKKIAVAITTQRSTVIAWHAVTGEAVSPALSWLDTRAQNELVSLSIDEPVLKEKTGLPCSPHYGASKLQWLINNDENVQQLQKQGKLKFGPLAAYLIFNLIESQTCYVDYANAHRTLLWNLQTKDWDRDLLNIFAINRSCLPTPVPNRFEYGILKQAKYPLVLVNGDQNSAIYGYGKLAENTSFINIGTGAFVLAKTHHEPLLNNPLLSTITYSAQDSSGRNNYEYALEGTVNGAGAALSWAENEWQINNIETLAWKDANDVPVFINTIGGLGSPFWTSQVKPRFLDTNKSYKDYTHKQCKAALMESIVFLITINIEEMCKYEISTNQLLLAGGVSRDHYLCQCLADLTGLPTTVSSFKEATSRGAAWLVMEQPEWEVLESKKFIASSNTALESRYSQFKQVINELVTTI